MNYYYATKEDVLGPKSLEELTELYRAGEISADTQVCTDEDESWQPASALIPIKKPSTQESLSTDTAQPAPALLVPPPSEQPPRIKNFEYSVIPFFAVIKMNENSSAAAAQLQSLIRGQASDGWEYVRLENVETYQAGDNGCFGLGATSPRTLAYSMAVFRR